MGRVGDPTVIGDEWLARESSAVGAELRSGGGLLGSFESLAGSRFDPAALAPPIIEFYEQTSDWRMDVWSQWCPAAWPFGWLLSAVFARRLQQLALPLRPLDVALGLDSRVVTAIDRRGAQLGAAWLRTLRRTGETVYSGWYGTTTLPGSTQPSIRVAFPLPNGRVTVFLAPSVDADGSLRLRSSRGAFGDDGAYLVVATNGTSEVAARRVPIHEDFRVFVDNEGVLRTDHVLDLGRVPVIRLHYRLTHAPS